MMHFLRLNDEQVDLVLAGLHELAGMGNADAITLEMKIANHTDRLSSDQAIAELRRILGGN